MTESDLKADLRRYLQDAREAMLWKLDGLSEYDVRRPLVPTGTNLLGLVKHVTGVEMGYLGDTFGRPCPDQLPFDESDPGHVLDQAEQVGAGRHQGPTDVVLGQAVKLP